MGAKKFTSIYFKHVESAHQPPALYTLPSRCALCIVAHFVRTSAKKINRWALDCILYFCELSRIAIASQSISPIYFNSTT